MNGDSHTQAESTLSMNDLHQLLAAGFLGLRLSGRLQTLESGPSWLHSSQVQSRRNQSENLGSNCAEHHSRKGLVTCSLAISGLPRGLN